MFSICYAILTQSSFLSVYSKAIKNETTRSSPIAAIVGTIIGLCVFLVVVIAFVYFRVRKRHSERYDVYGRNATINFRPSNYEHVYEGAHHDNDVSSGLKSLSKRIIAQNECEIQSVLIMRWNTLLHLINITYKFFLKQR